MLEVIINEVICGDVPLASLTIGAIRKKIADYVDNRRFGKDANEIQIWADVSAFIKEPHKNLSRYNQYQLYSYESLSNPRMSASLHIFNGASTMQILTLRTANFLISEHLDQFR